MFWNTQKSVYYIACSGLILKFSKSWSGNWKPFYSIKETHRTRSILEITNIHSLVPTDKIHVKTAAVQVSKSHHASSCDGPTIPCTFVHCQGDKTLDTYTRLCLRRTSHDNAWPAEYAHQQGQPVRDRGCGCLPDCLVVNRQGAVMWQRHVLHAAGPEPEINVNAQKLPRKHKSKRALVPSWTSVLTALWLG